MKYGNTVTVGLPMEEALTAVRAAFKEEGFGILTEINIQATLKEKLGADLEPYVILGACNPELARKALEIEPEIGLLLPCNVVVRQSQGSVLVHALDPQVMVAIPGQPGLQDIADDAGARIARAMAALSTR